MCYAILASRTIERNNVKIFKKKKEKKYISHKYYMTKTTIKIYGDASTNIFHFCFFLLYIQQKKKGMLFSPNKLTLRNDT